MPSTCPTCHLLYVGARCVRCTRAPSPSASPPRPSSPSSGRAARTETLTVCSDAAVQPVKGGAIGTLLVLVAVVLLLPVLVPVLLVVLLPLLVVLAIPFLFGMGRLATGAMAFGVGMGARAGRSGGARVELTFRVRSGGRDRQVRLRGHQGGVQLGDEVQLRGFDTSTGYVAVQVRNLTTGIVLWRPGVRAGLAAIATVPVLWVIGVASG